MDYYKYYLPTCHLRFVRKEIVQADWTVKIKTVLQQKWKSSIVGQDDEWRDVELVDDFD